MAEIDSNVTKLFEWDKKRKEKIKNLQKEKSYEIEKNKHIPQINKKSRNMVNRNKNKKENIFVRLSKEDDFVKEKKKILEELLSPNFKPNINLTFRKFDNNIFEEKKERNQKYKRNNIINKDNKDDKDNKDNKEDFIRITVNRNNNIKPKTIKANVENIIEKENENIENDEVCNIFRKMIINNMNNKVRNKSV